VLQVAGDKSRACCRVGGEAANPPVRLRTLGIWRVSVAVRTASFRPPTAGGARPLAAARHRSGVHPGRPLAPLPVRRHRRLAGPTPPAQQPI